MAKSSDQVQMEETQMAPSSPTQVPPPAETDGTEPDGLASDNPAGSGARGVRGGANMYGAFSMETFCSAGSLSYTHDDADGFLAYVRQFTAPNFWYQDAGVKIWAYYETYDNWLDTYGMDAVCVAYHSGHGGMDGSGVFYAPMGAAWAGNDCTAISSNMRLGNEHAKYIFWSTCLSCRVLDGHSPIRTWQAANLGFRMLFGFETVSWDSPNYGKFLWEEWRKNKSFSQAWLDASWRIAHDQAPSAVACGASAAEAQDRLYNERFFTCSAVSHDWWWWRWYYASASTRPRLLTVPDYPLVAQLSPVDVRAEAARAFADRFGLDVSGGQTGRMADGGFRLAAGDQWLAYGADGSIEVQLAKPNTQNRQQVPEAEARSIAQGAVSRYGLDQIASLVRDRVVYSYEAGGSATGSQREGPYVTGTTVEFRQTINGVPIITEDRGLVRVTVDNDGNVTNIYSSLSAVESLSEQGRTRPPSPQPPGASSAELSPGPGGAEEEPSPEPGGIEQELAASFNKLLMRWASTGSMPVAFSTVPNSTEIGYEIRGDDAVLVARRAVEVDFGRGYRKRYWVTTPIS